ncbi:MAG: DUF3427 domain-containing protein [Candidatus Brocadiae bacterium]|nr:DUF3427 domain-containing protein [Candidatus Brocadiia bacterium]
MTESLPPGLYEDVITERLAGLVTEMRRQSQRVDTDRLDPEESHVVLARFLRPLLIRAFDSISGSAEERLAGQVRLCNRVLKLLGDAAPASELGAGDHVDESGEELLTVCPAGPVDLIPARPEIPLSFGALMVNAKGQPTLAHEIGAELESADRVDLLCSFIKFEGLRLLIDRIKSARDRGVRFRVLTTVYLGATHRKALDELVRLGVEVKISYEWRRTRLHAKAWLLYRNSGLSTAYVGSSNLSKSAFLDGLEWNVRVAARETPDILRSFDAAFSSYWDGPDFEDYDPARDSERLDQALAAAAGGTQSRADVSSWVSVQLSPWPFQQEMLDKLRAEREIHGRRNNLLVAATGTGKTLISAFDYRDLRRRGEADSILFVAHREELLDQAIGAYRLVLRESDFGEKHVGGHRPTRWKHVFASVQSLANLTLAEWPADRFDMIVVDEFHHAAAPTYRRLLDHFRPKYLLGMTATPERADTRDILGRFGGITAVEMRLWDALERGLLAPFHYFGVNDGTDLSGVTWKRGYDESGLDKVYTGNRIRALLIAQEVQRRITDPLRMRALGFCVSVAHAKFMAAEFSRLGLPAQAVTGGDPVEDRDEARRKLAKGEVCTLFTVDLFNEGVDIPEVDTLLFLRPTESATLFLQQLGRGLRLCEGKSCTTVLDFIGPARREFKFEDRFKALTCHSGGVLTRHVADGFPFLPAGCSIQLDHVARSIVLENLKSAVRFRTSHFVEVAKRLAQGGSRVRLREFLDEAGVTLTTFYAKHRSLTAVLTTAGIAGPAPSPLDEHRLSRGLGRLLAADDPDRLAMGRFLCGEIDPGVLSPRESLTLSMLHFDLWGLSGGPSTLAESVSRIRACPNIRREIAEILEIVGEQAGTLTFAMDELVEIPMRIHARYSRDEILAAMGDSTPGAPRTLREGVRFEPVHRADLLFITLRKSAREYSPTTMYRDYAQTSTLFHWQSQSTTSAGSSTGMRYIHHKANGSHVLLFVRESKDDDFDVTRPYVFLGPADYVSHEGERPMNILWRLRTPMPAALLKEALVAAG